MPPKIGHSRLIRKGYLAPQEQVLLEMHSSGWFFFPKPVSVLILAALGYYSIASAAWSFLPQWSPLRTWMGRTTIPGASSDSGSALVVVGFLVAALVIWYYLWRYWAGAEELGSRPKRNPRPILRGVVLLLAILSAVVMYGGAAAASRALPGVPVITPFLSRLPRAGLASSPVPADPLMGIFTAIALVGAVWYLRRWLDWTEDAYAVTDDRLIKQHRRFTGIGWAYDVRDVLVRQVRNVDVYQSRGWRKFFRCGTLNIHSLYELPETKARPTKEGTVTDPVLDRKLPYTNPRLPKIDEFPGVEWWFSVPNPWKVERTIQGANVDLERGPSGAR